ncbi:MAG: ATP-binding protein [Haloarcula sp.]
MSAHARWNRSVRRDQCGTDPVDVPAVVSEIAESYRDGFHGQLEISVPDEAAGQVTGDEPITKLRHGTGLGLWLVVWVTETYGGTVDFSSGPRGGAVVTVELPRIDS